MIRLLYISDNKLLSVIPLNSASANTTSTISTKSSIFSVSANLVDFVNNSSIKYPYASSSETTVYLTFLPCDSIAHGILSRTILSYGVNISTTNSPILLN